MALPQAFRLGDLDVASANVPPMPKRRKRFTEGPPCPERTALSLLPLWEKVDRRREATARRLRGLFPQICSLREPLIRRFAPPSPTRGEGKNRTIDR